MKLLKRAGIATLILAACLEVLIGICFIALEVSARMPSAKVVTVVDSSMAGVYARTYTDSLPESKRSMLGKGDMLFLERATSPFGTHRLLRIMDRGLQKQLTSSTEMKVVAIRVTRRYPAARIFRWLGPLEWVDYIIAEPSGPRNVDSGIIWWASVKA